MGRKPTGRPRGRPAKEIDKSNFEKLCGLQCTKSEIAGFFECCQDVIEEWCKKTYGCNFSDAYIMYAEGGKIALRRNQFALSEKSATMAIWLGKQWLGQKDDNMREPTDEKVSIQINLKDCSEEDGK